MKMDSKAKQAFSPDVIERFWSKVDIRALDDCWPWTAGRFDSGYGAFTVRRKTLRAHRCAYAITYGSTELLVLHSCDNPPCCNPRHLLAGTNQDNVDDRNQKLRQTRGQRHPHAKLTDELVRAVRADPRGHRAVAADLGVARSLIQMVRQRKIWAHVDD